MNNGLYIHVPFCKRKCIYCDFYSLADKMYLTEPFVRAVIRNLQAQSRAYDTVYFGGGTPSLLTPNQIYEILSSADISAQAEISAECNPDSADFEKLCGFRKAGINRISIGIQSFDENELKMLGRLHNSEQAKAAICTAQKAGFDNISADLMLGLPYQSSDTIRKNIQILTNLGVTHVSAYMLKIEESTPLANKTDLISAVADDDNCADFYIDAAAVLESNGYKQYEISNFSKAGFECRHNLKYWRCENYLGIGPSAHSCIDSKRFAVPKDLKAFISRDKQEEIITEDNPYTNEEKMMLSLRLSEGFSLDEIPDKKEKVLRTAKPMAAGGLLTIDNERISLTTKGFLVSNEIICRLEQALE